MGFLDQIVSSLANVIDSLVDAAVSKPPVGLLVITLVIIAASILPESVRELARTAALAAAGLLVMVKILGPVGWSAIWG
jgi:hypothetical protein